MTNPQPTPKSINGWTPARRLKQSQAIRRWSPWKKSTGPRTASGKTRAAKNAYKHGMRSATTLDFSRLLTRHARFLTLLNRAITFETQRRRIETLQNTANELMDLVVSPRPVTSPVIPAKAGIYGMDRMDSSLRRNDGCKDKLPPYKIAPRHRPIMQKTCFFGGVEANS